MKMTVKQVHEIFFEKNVSVDFIYQLAREKKIPHVRLSDYKILFDSEILEKWWTDQMVSPTEEVEESHAQYGTLRKVL